MTLYQKQKFFDRLETAKDATHAIFVGYDPFEDAAAKMLAHSIRSRTKIPDLKIIPIVRDELLAHELCNRPVDPKGSTQFSITRFMVPHLMNYNGVGIFFDCDMLITRNISEMFDLFDNTKAVQVVKHEYTPKTTDKMGGLPQTIYPRKQWSSTVIYNCDHPSNKKLSNKIVELETPQFLHRFQWLKNKEIGELPLEFNFLIGEYDIPETHPFNIHHTLGSPLFRDCQDVDYAEYWKDEFNTTFERRFSEEDIIN